VDESDAIFFWKTEYRTQAVSQNQALFRGLKNLSNTSQCRKQSSKLRSKNTSRTPYSQNNLLQSDEMQTLRSHLSKNHPYKKPSMQHI
jgi:hypothetical protein